LSEIDTSRGMAYGDDVMVEDYLLEVEERVDALPKINITLFWWRLK
jgi:hypothetical protein